MATGVFTQKYEDQHHPVEYFSILYPVSPSVSTCCACLQLFYFATSNWIHPWLESNPMHIPHDLGFSWLMSYVHFSSNHLTKQELLLLSAPDVSIKHCITLNPATLLPSSLPDPNHNCLLSISSPPWPAGNPPPKCLFDGSYLKNSEGNYQAGYAIVTY